MSVPWENRVDVAWQFSRSSRKSANESRDSVADLMEGLGTRTNINALRNRAKKHGYLPPSATSFTDRETAERQLSARYLQVAECDAYFDTERHLTLKKSALRDRESWRMPRTDSGGRYDPLCLLRDSPLTVRCDSFGFHPGEGPVFSEDGRLLANRYRPYVPTPLPPTLTERQVLTQFCRHLFPRGSDLSWLRHLFDTLAYLVQNPGQRVKFTMILVGAVEGSGKSTLMEEIPRLLFGVNNVVTVSTHELESKFTDWLSEAWIVVFAEVALGTHREASRIANALKDNQTNEYLRIIEKGRPGRRQRNRVSFLGTSNDEVHAIQLSAFDRRTAVCATPAPIMPAEFSKSLYGFLKSPRAAGVLRYLAVRRALSHFKPSAVHH